MLKELFIRNIILIDKLDISFTEGFCVLTGETGAGKSILLGALGFALGSRASSGLLRAGEKQGSVTAIFDVSGNSYISELLEGQGIIASDEVYLRRIINNDGKTKAFVNDVPVGVNLLSELSENLIEIHGQHDQRGLMDAKTHRFILDQYGRLEHLLTKVSLAFEKYKSLYKELEQLKAAKDKARADEEYLKYVLKELEAISPKAGEEEQLAEKRKILMNRDKLVDAVNSALENLLGKGVDSAIVKAQDILVKNADLHSGFAEITETLNRAQIELSEAVNSLQLAASSVDFDDSSLETIEERLFAMRAAARKYNVDVDGLVAYCDEIRDKLGLIENADERVGELEGAVVAAKAEYLQLAAKLTAERRKASLSLEKSLTVELAPLRMENTKLQVNIEALPEDQWSAGGVDKVVFLASTNPGMPFAPLAKIASGGELSRFMLAMKVVLSEVNSVASMIFDEVDTGIGGAVADAVGKRLSLLGNKLQVLAITHQPQVAARGNIHFKIAKKQTSAGTFTGLTVLSPNEREEELARMLAGSEITSEARAAAVSLLAGN